MKKLMKRMMGILAALALLVASTAATSTTADAATVTGYTWEYTTNGGTTWSAVPASMRPAIASLDYTSGTFTITSAGPVIIYGVTGEITVVKAMSSSAVVSGDNLLVDGEAVLSGVSEPIYVYFEIELESGFHSTVYTRFINLTY
jgi:hypothetical protein